MRRGSRGDVWRVVLAAVALLATLAALYVQIFERRSRQEEDRLTASRLAEALEDSRDRLKAEISAELRAELAQSEPAGRSAAEPRPGTVLRRSESGSRALEQVGGAGGAEHTLEDRLDALARRADETDRTVRREIEEVRAELRREQGVSGEVLLLLLAAVTALALLVLDGTAALWAGGREKVRDPE